MISIPCRNGYTVLSAISFLFLCVSAIGISMTLNTESIPFFKQNENILIPFLSTMCGIFGLLLIFTFLDIQLFNCFRCCVNEYSPTEDNENNHSLYSDAIGTTAHQLKENDPLLYPKIYPRI